MANEYMTIEELKKLAVKKHIHIPSGYKKLDIIEYINDEIARMKGDKKKEKSISKSKTISPKIKSPARINYAPVTHQVYAPVSNVINNYYTVPEIKEIAKVNKIETPSGIRKEELIELVNEILNERFKNKTPVKIPKELSIKAKSRIPSPKPKSPMKQQQQKQQPQQQQKQQPQQQKQQPQQQKQQPQQQKQQPQQQKQQSILSKFKSVSPKAKSVSPKAKSVSPKAKSVSPKAKSVSPKAKVKEELPELLPIPQFSTKETPEEETFEEETFEEETENVSLPVLQSTPVKSKSIQTKFLPRVFNYDEEE
jgi:hypothetical protein